MSSFRLVLASLVCTSYFSLVQTQDPQVSIKTTPFSGSKISDNTQSKNKEPLDNESLKISDPFTQEDIQEMELVFEFSPEKAQDILKYLKDPNYFPSGVQYRSAFFVGEPGSGKTVMAQSIAYKMAQQGWDYKIIPSTSFLQEYRNQTAICLRRELEIIALSNKPTILIIDELHRLLENTNSKHHDTDATSTVLWTFLDKQKNNTNFFFIGTMNRATKLPKPFKDRIFSGYIAFPVITDSAMKNKLLCTYLINANTHFDTEITDTFLNQELEKIGPCSGRNIKCISQNILMMYKGNNANHPLLIKKDLISQAIKEFLQTKTAMEYDTEEETDEQRQERYHNENMHLQKKYHEEQIQIQYKNQEAEERRFIQQQLLAARLINYQYWLDNSSTSYIKEAFHIITPFISEEQKEIYYQSLNPTKKD